MKKTWAALLVAGMMAGFTGCGNPLDDERELSPTTFTTTIEQDAVTKTSLGAPDASRMTFADVILDEYTTRRRDYNTSYFWIPSDHYPMVIDFSVE